MYFKAFLVSICFIAIALSNGEIKTADVNMLDAVKQFCHGKSSRNFCSTEQLKVSYEIIRQQDQIRHQERLIQMKIEKQKEEERLKKIKLKQLNEFLKKNSHYSFLKDFTHGRIFK
jgi:hypothetical protein